MTKRSSGNAPGRNVRLLRVGENIRHAMARILNRDSIQDPAVAGVPITVSEVEVSPDLRNATVFVVPLMGKDQEEVAAALNRAGPFLRGRLSGEVHLKYMPKLKFVIDPSFDEASRIDAILADPKVRRDIESVADDEDDAPDQGISQGHSEG